MPYVDAFLLRRCYTEQAMNCFNIGCFSFGERHGVHMKITQAAHNHWKTVGTISAEYGFGGGCQKQLDEKRRKQSLPALS